MLAVLLGTISFGLFLCIVPARMRVKAKKEIDGPLRVEVYLWPRSVPFVLTGLDLDLSTVVSLVGRVSSRKRTDPQAGFRPGLSGWTGWLRVAINSWKALRKVSRRLYRSITCHHLEMDLGLGGGDAAATAWIAGAAGLWLADVQKNLARNVRLRTTPRLSIYPSFTAPGVSIRLDCTLRVKLIHILLTVWGLLSIMRKISRVTG